ncbi:MAG: DUF1294 domain-containing protein [Pseudoxanthomonas sp.]
MHRAGKVQDWNDERGYGFIVPLDATGDGARSFCHVRDYPQAGRRPELGELVKYAATRQSDGRWRATEVRRAAQPPIGARISKPVAKTYKAPLSVASDLLRSVVVLAYIAFIAWAIKHGRMILETVFIPVSACIVSYLGYAAAKHFAQSNRWRIPEANLHLLELLGGMARRAYRPARTSPQDPQGQLPASFSG